MIQPATYTPLWCCSRILKFIRIDAVEVDFIVGIVMSVDMS